MKYVSSDNMPPALLTALFAATHKVHANSADEALRECVILRGELGGKQYVGGAQSINQFMVK